MSGGDPVLFLRHGADRGALLAELRTEQPDIEVVFWRPSLATPFPPGAAAPLLYPYSLFHWAGLFDSPHYGAILLRDRGRIVHRSLVMPRFARYPFMEPDDLQIGAVETLPAARGRGLAVRAILEIVDRYGQPGRSFWYLTEASNAASVHAAKRAGFALVGRGEKKPRLGLKFLGHYDITPPRAGAPPSADETP